jgi:hypothetical protein
VAVARRPKYRQLRLGMDSTTAAASDSSSSAHVMLGTFVWVNAALKVFQKLAGLSNSASWLPCRRRKSCAPRYAPKLDAGRNLPLLKAERHAWCGVPFLRGRALQPR